MDFCALAVLLVSFLTRHSETVIYQDMIGVAVQIFGLVHSTLLRGCGVGTK
jgi:hypothetical protein